MSDIDDYDDELDFGFMDYFYVEEPDDEPVCILQTYTWI